MSSVEVNFMCIDNFMCINKVHNIILSIDFLVLAAGFLLKTALIFLDVFSFK